MTPNTYPTHVGKEPCEVPPGMPLDMAWAIKRYVEDKQPVGGFLRAALANDLTGAAGRADLQNQRALAAIALFILWNVPKALYGSREAVVAHIGEED